MSKNSISKKIGTQTMTAVIVHGISPVGITLSKTLLKQGGHVIVLDQYREESRVAIKKLKKFGNIDFVDLRGINEFYKSIARIDYIFYMQHTYLTRKTSLSNHNFLAESNLLNLNLHAVLTYKTKFVLISSATISNQLADTRSSDNNTIAPYSREELQKYSETLTAEYYDKSKANVRIIRLGATLNTNGTISGDPTISKLFSDIITKGKISIQGEGLQSHLLISENDAVYGILKLTFDKKTTGEVIALYNDHTYSTLSIAYKILELNSEVTQIEFVDSTKKQPLVYESYTPISRAQDFGWTQKDTIAQSILNILKKQYKQAKKTWQPNKKSTSSNDDSKSPATIIKSGKVKTRLGQTVTKLITPINRIKSLPTQLRQNFNFRSVLQFFILLLGIGTLFYFFIAPIANIGINGILLYRKGRNLNSKIETLNFDTVTDDLNDAHRYSQNIGRGVNKLKWLFTVTKQDKLYSSTSHLVYGLEYALQGATQASEALLPLAKYAQDFEPAVDFDNDLPSTTREYRTQLLEMKENQYQLERAISNFSLANQSIQSIQPKDFPKFAESYIIQLQAESAQATKLIVPYEQVVSFLPELLGIQERKRYLILLQNPSELRSSGGWISSYGIIGIEGGQIRELEVDDVYNLDGLLKSSSTNYMAPKDMQKALNIKEWNLSLSNWNPDFAETASSASYFVKESGKTYSIDGVIAINIPFIQKLLDEWNGINIPGENEPITSDNLYDKIFEMHSSYTPGSTVKSTFLSKLANQTVTKLLSSDVKGYLALSNILFDSLESKDLVVYINEYKANKFFNNRGWAGTFQKEYQSIPVEVEWNWGGNKSNLFLKKETNLQIEILNQDQIRYNYELTIKNNSSTNIYPEGDYINYFRLYLPEDAQIETVTGFKENLFDISYKNNGFKVVGGWFNIPVQTSKKLQIRYVTENTSDVVSYPISLQGANIAGNFLFRKQPGDLNHTYKVEVFYPYTWAVHKSNELSTNGSTLSTQFELESDKEIEITWAIK